MKNYKACYTTISAFERVINKKHLLFKLYADWEKMSLEEVARKYGTFPVIIKAYENWFLKW